MHVNSSKVNSLGVSQETTGRIVQSGIYIAVEKENSSQGCLQQTQYVWYRRSIALIIAFIGLIYFHFVQPIV